MLLRVRFSFRYFFYFSLRFLVHLFCTFHFVTISYLSVRFALFIFILLLSYSSVYFIFYTPHNSRTLSVFSVFWPTVSLTHKPTFLSGFGLFICSSHRYFFCWAHLARRDNCFCLTSTLFALSLLAALTQWFTCHFLTLGCTPAHTSKIFLNDTLFSDWEHTHHLIKCERPKILCVCFPLSRLLVYQLLRPPSKGSLLSFT